MYALPFLPILSVHLSSILTLCSSLSSGLPTCWPLYLPYDLRGSIANPIKPLQLPLLLLPEIWIFWLVWASPRPLAGLLFLPPMSEGVEEVLVNLCSQSLGADVGYAVTASCMRVFQKISGKAEWKDKFDLLQKLFEIHAKLFHAMYFSLSCLEMPYFWLPAPTNSCHSSLGVWSAALLTLTSRFPIPAHESFFHLLLANILEELLASDRAYQAAQYQWPCFQSLEL